MRLRPVARSDLPQIFSQRIDLRHLRQDHRAVAIPSFEQWESQELPSMQKAGPVMVVEDRQGVFKGLVRLYRIEFRDRRGYLEVRLPFDFDMDDTAVIETCLAILDYAFAYLSLRKVYVETTSSNDALLRRLSKLGFEEEVRLEEYFCRGDGYADQLHLGLHRKRWERTREGVVASLDISFAAETVR